MGLLSALGGFVVRELAKSAGNHIADSVKEDVFGESAFTPHEYRQHQLRKNLINDLGKLKFADTSSATASPNVEIPHRPKRSINAKSQHPLDRVYHRLCIKGNEDLIRVVTLTPGSRWQTLDFEMKIINFRDEKYEALSYRWAGSEDQAMAINDFFVYDVFSNLHSALQRIRSRITEPVNLWFDAICIKQTDEDEVNQHLGIMGEIYASAKRVVVWLGEGTPESDMAFSHFNSLGYVTLERLFWGYENDRDAKNAWRNFEGDVMTRDWWGRAWMVQEMACARSMTFMCGDQEMEHELMFKLALFSYTSGRPLSNATLEEPLHFRWQSFNYMYIARNMVQTGFSPDDIAPWIYRFRYWESGKEEDRVFAYLGMANTCPIRKQPGYLWPDIYIDTTRHVLQHNGYIDFICLGKEPGRKSGLPTWVPDFSVKFTANPQTPPLWCGWGKAGGVYNASNGTPFRKIKNDDRRKLCVQARFFGSIKSVGIVHDINDRCIEDSKRLAFEIAGFRPHSRYPGTYDTCERALGKTLVWDLNWQGNRCSNIQGFFEDEEDKVPDQFSDSELPVRERIRSYKVQLRDSRVKYRLGRCFAIVKDASYAMVPRNTVAGDEIWVLAGATVPMVFRKVVHLNGPTYKLIGECYVHGIMNGDTYLNSDADDEPILID
ncbi:heterokaryon incompatibility protein-domain-containing protein [Bisporella sp. PMI_857]|nr:heterokaryon incompatibility protein-domain-containing protein [Bisporella sp. PMI_857]